MTNRHAAVSAAPPTPHPDPLLGRSINDRFTITGLIARGGMGKVYRAEQAPLGRPCALKVLNPNYAGEADPEFHRRFFLEASIVSRLTHPNTITIFDYGRTDDDIYYMAMEYLEGHTLHHVIRADGPLTEERMLHVARQICRSLREAHLLGVIHRDLKPANIFLVEHGDEPDHVKVLDFGLVKNMREKADEQLTQTGLFMGSPKYMAPEQIQGNPVDQRTDIYSLGCIMYEMMTGKVPFDRNTSVSILMAHVNEPPPPMREVKPDIVLSPVAEELILRCISKDPNGRPSSMDELLAGLKRASGMIGMTGELHSMSGYPLTNVAYAHSSSSSGMGRVMATQSATPLPLAASDMSAELRGQGGSRAWIPFAVLGAVAVGAAAGLLAFHATSGEFPILRGPARGPTQAIPTAQARVELAPVTPTAPPPVATAPVEAPATVRITSEPEGASVRVDGVEVCTATPCDVTIREPKRGHKVTFVKNGHRTEQRELAPEQTTLKVKMVRGAGRAAPPATAPPTAAVEAPPATPSGFKEAPY